MAATDIKEIARHQIFNQGAQHHLAKVAKEEDATALIAHNITSISRKSWRSIKMPPYFT